MKILRNLTQPYATLRNLTPYLIILFCIVFIFGCSENSALPIEEKHPNEKYSKIYQITNTENSKYDLISITDALEQAAIALSKALKKQGNEIKN